MIKVLMIGPIPPEGSYIGGIGIMLKGIFGNWSSRSTELIYLNSETRQRDYSKAGRFSFENVKYFFVFLRRVLGEVNNVSPDIIHFHSSFGAALLKDLLIAMVCKTRYSVKVVFHIHFADIEAILLPRQRVLRSLEIRMLYRFCDKIILMADMVQRGFLVEAPRMEQRIRDRSFVLKNYTIIPERAVDRSLGGEVVILFLGNIGKRKGAFDILDACSCLSGQLVRHNVKLVFAGPFDSSAVEAEFMDRVQQDNLDQYCVFTGAVSHDRTSELFLAADIFILPSYSEGIPIAMLEAMSYGLPVIVSNVGGIPEVVKDQQHGLVIPSGDTEILANAIGTLIATDAGRLEMGNNARQLILKEHSMKHYNDSLDKLYQSLSI